MDKSDEVKLETICLEEKSPKGTPTMRNQTANTFSSDLPVESKEESSSTHSTGHSTAETKNMTVSPVPTKKATPHWSTTPAGSLVARVTCYLYKQLLVPPLKDFFREHCHHFANKDDTGGYPLHCMDLYREYEKLIETSVLIPFAEEEGSSVEEILSAIEDAICHKSIERNFELMLRATSFEKFVMLMQSRHRQLQLEADAKDNSNRFSTRSKSSKGEKGDSPRK